MSWGRIMSTKFNANCFKHGSVDSSAGIFEQLEIDHLSSRLRIDGECGQGPDILALSSFGA